MDKNTIQTISEEQEYISEKQASVILGISVKKLQKDRLLKVGMPYYKIGRSVRYSLIGLHEWVDQQIVI